MTLRMAAVSICAVMLVSALAWANVCPLCLQSIPDTEKFCPRHKAEIQAKTASATEEKKLVDNLAAARADYKARLEELETFYESRGYAEGLRKIRQEIKDHVEGSHFGYVNWEDKLPELSATTPNPEADKLLREADGLRKSLTPWGRGSRLKEAAVKYEEILSKYPSSTAVDSAAFGLGEIHSNRSVGNYARAVHFYELAYVSNPKEEHDAAYRAAEVSDYELRDFENAARFYWIAAKTSRSSGTRQRAAARLKVLQKNRFGTSFTLEEKAPEKPVEDSLETK